LYKADVTVTMATSELSKPCNKKKSNKIDYKNAPKGLTIIEST